MKNTKSTLTMDGETFNECWHITGLEIKDNDNIVVNFINDTIVNVFVNGVKKWSVIKSIF